MYDIIGDIHGQADKLKALLVKLGYKNKNGSWSHPDRQALFVGDFIDRGPSQIETLQIVRSMIDQGSAKAVMGNHEFNAIAFFTKDENNPRQHLRLRNEKNYKQHAAFLKEVGEDSKTHREWIDWFYTLPLWMEDDNLRLVHACWHSKFMSDIKEFLNDDNTLNERLVELASRKGSRQYKAVEAICKGTEITLPSPVTFTDKEGNVRRQTRTKWWDSEARTFRSAAFLNEETQKLLPDTELPDYCLVNYDNIKPVFFGHYWFKGDPRVLSSKACCVDYSAAIGENPLVAYQWDGENYLKDDKLVSSLDKKIEIKNKDKKILIR